MAKRINVTYFDNFDYDFEDYRKAYIDFLEENEMEKKLAEDDDNVYNFIYEMLDLNWDNFQTNLKYSKYADIPCVVNGSLGLWFGVRNICSTCFTDLWSAISKCVDNMDGAIIKQVNGHLEIEGIHHDGRNYFEIHLLNNKGIDAKERLENGWGNADLSCRCYHKAIQGYLW